MRHALLAAAAGVLTAAMLLLAGGQAPLQAGQTSLDDPLQRLHAGLFREHSVLPTDPSQSIEQLLEQQSAALGRIEARLAALHPAPLDALERRLAEFERGRSNIDTSNLPANDRKLDLLEAALERLDGSGVADLELEVRQVRHSVEDLARSIRDLPRGADAGIGQTELDRLARDIRSETSRAVDAIEDDVRGVSSALGNLEHRVRTLERR